MDQISQLLDLGADPNQTLRGADTVWSSYLVALTTPGTTHVPKDHEQIIESLLLHGADPDLELSGGTSFSNILRDSGSGELQIARLTNLRRSLQQKQRLREGLRVEITEPKHLHAIPLRRRASR